MSTSRAARSVFLAAAIPMALLASSGAASAQDADVTWTNQATYDCLRSSTSRNAVWTNPQGKDYACRSLGGSLGEVQWHDDNSNLENPDGAWAEKTPGSNGKCLTAYERSVYLEPCSGPVNYYEQWYEEWDGNYKAFRLKNRQSRLYLTADNDGNVSMTGWANDRHQLWK
ncbi:hypothetical protein ACH4PU_33570 [Streptomyces sp. NPDC021100]|uniref:hypothetical protein n=1 Tax=Streptomyces sp. NPDC021100 TaxID=3365114 RepID=UPI00378C2967